ncbi:MAG: hypothetical protein BroJett038_34120 [Chloroflexota bacterium]|jgi:hypothetical protein|nr:MAG: hypothetical protein BroJett038_34120 [Chloroflexota bacterium]
MFWKNLQNVVVTVVLAGALAIFILNLAANPQLLDWVLPVTIGVIAVLWVLSSRQTRHN